MIFNPTPQRPWIRHARSYPASMKTLPVYGQSGREVLLSAEDAGAVVAIDQAIEAEQRNAEIYKDRIKALQEECRKAEYQAREDQRKKAIAKISPRLKKREETASNAGDAYRCRPTVFRTDGP